SPGVDGPQTGDAGVTIVPDEAARFSELGNSAVIVAFESIGSGQERAELGMRRSSVARPFAPDNRLVEARLQQMRTPDPAIEKADLWIAGTEPDGLILGWNQRLNRPGHEIAPAKMGVCVGPVAVERDDGLVFEDGLVVPVLRA